jgi:hypothetical protein
MHAGVWDGVDYDGGASCEMRQNPRCFPVSMAAAGSCIYIRTRGGIVSRSQSQTDSVSNSYTYRTRNQKNKTAKGSCAPARRWIGFRRTIHAPPRPGPARRGEASERARVVFPFSSHTPLRVVERTHYIKRSNSSSTSGVGLNLAPPLAILHMGFEISKIAMGLAH